MELRQLRYFLALAEHLSFTRAAEAVHIAQSTLSHQIKALEDELGRPLFERRGRSVHLTEHGAAFLPRIQRLLGELEDGLLDLERPLQSARESVAFASISSFPFNILSGAMGRLLGSWPNVEIRYEELPSEEITARVQSGNIDLGVLYRPSKMGGFWFEPLYTDEFVLVVDKDHPLAGRRNVRLGELQGLRLGILGNLESRSLILEYFSRGGIDPHIVVETNKIPPLLGLVEGTDIATLAPRRSASLMPVNVALISLVHPTPYLELGLLWNRKRPPIRAAATLTHYLRQYSRDD